MFNNLYDTTTTKHQIGSGGKGIQYDGPTTNIDIHYLVDFINHMELWCSTSITD